MRFDTKQLLERLTLALGVAAVGITLIAIARSNGAPILVRHDPAVIAAAHN